jgi:hypothetical protein
MLAANASLRFGGRDVKVDNLKPHWRNSLRGVSQAADSVCDYRLQFNAGFTLRRAEALVSYLNDWDHSAMPPAVQGPYWQQPWLRHLRSNRLNQSLAASGFSVFTDALRDCGMASSWMGANHVSMRCQCLVAGRAGAECSSPFAAYFDISGTRFGPIWRTGSPADSGRPVWQSREAASCG